MKLSKLVREGDLDDTLLLGRQSKESRTQWITKRGDHVWVKSFASSFGNQILIQFVSVDQETKLQNEKNELFNALNSNPNIISFTMSKRYQMMWVSDSFVDLLGYSKEELAGTYALSLFHKDDLPKLQKAIKEFELIGKHGDVMFRQQKANGEYMLFRGYITRLGDVYLLHNVCADHLKLIEKKEQKIKALFSLMDANVYVVTIVTDSSGTIVWCSRGCESMLGFKSREMVGKSERSMLHPRDAHITLKGSSSKYRRITKYGEYVWLVGSRQQKHNQTIIQEMSIHTTVQLDEGIERVRQRTATTGAEKRVSKFVALELERPIACILDALETPVDISAARSWAKHLGDLRYEIDAVHSVLAGEMKFAGERVSFESVASDVVKMVAEKSKSADRLTTSGSPHLVLFADREALKRVLMCLVWESFRNTSGIVALSAERYDSSSCAIHIEYENKPGSRTKLDVDDLFIPFHAFSKVSPGNLPGRGTNLSISASKLQIEAMGGSLRFTSTSNRSKYILFLPFERKAIPGGTKADTPCIDERSGQR